MMPIILILTGQTLSGPPPAPAAPQKTSPVIYALVFVEKRPASESMSRKEQMVYEAARCRYEREVLEAALRVNTVSRLKVVHEQKNAQNPKNARKWLEKTLRVESVEDTGVLRISFTAGSQKEQVAIVNTVAKAYIQWANEFRRQNYEGRIAQCSKDCAAAKKAIRDAELEIAKLDGMIARDMNEAERIAEQRNNLKRWIANRKEIIEKREPEIRKRQEGLRKPHSIVLELAELPPESK